jgi:hypothetical protein
MYLLAQRGQWRESLTYLALGNDPDWQKLAAESLETKTAEEKIELADRWSALGKEENAPSKEIARHFYQEALADKSLVGHARAAAEEKLKALGDPPAIPSVSVLSAMKRPLPLNEWTELLPLIDFDQDLEKGFFLRGPRNSVIMDDSTHSGLRLPVLLEDCSYDLTVEFRPGTPAQQVHLMLPVGKQSVALIVDGSADRLHTFFEVPGAKQVKGNLLLPNQAYRYDVAVRLQDDLARLTFSLNGNKIVEHDSSVSDFQPNKRYSLRTDKQLGFASYESKAVFTSCQVRPISGAATIGRDVPLIKPIPASIMALQATSLSIMRPVSTKFTRTYYGVNSIPGGAHPPIVGGVLCREYLYAHAPSSMTYAVPAKAKYFTAATYCARTIDVRFIVRIDGKDVFSTERRALSTVVVEIPEGAKELQLVCEPLENNDSHHSFWCFPVFRQ